MVSDTPSPKDEKREPQAEAASQETETTAAPPAAPETNDAAVKTAMADVAAAIRRHEEHGAAESSEETTTDEEQKATTGPETPVTPPPRSNTGGLVAAAIAGGIIGIAGAVALSYAGLLGSTRDNSQLESEVATLRQEIATLKSDSQSGAGDLQSRVAALQQKVDGLSAGGGETLSALQQQVADLQNAVKSDEGRIEGLSQSLQGSISNLQSSVSGAEQKLTTLEQKVNTPGKDLAVARAIAAAGLKSAIDRGASFAAELSTYEQVADDKSGIEALKPMASEGVPTQEELAAQFSAIADHIIEASDAPPADANIFNRLVDSAKGLVSVRPVGDVEGEGTPAIVARIENDLNQGRLKDAASEWQSLPQDGKDVSAQFDKALQARIKADDLVSETLSKALGATAGVSAEPATPANEGGSQ
ncbi:mitofilin family membrane protein [Martelella endophytica]|uniref:mitofilin family membrane protein n=1 Tax=Martelella endophytica TaxID=1486262 RepID=UPI0006978471|nr:mitofilin family membrane protein [Martelella endophytica]